MSEEITRDMSDGRPFEERLFTRLDSIDARLQSLEDQAARSALDTKPIWERALAEILEVKEEVLEVKERIANLENLTHQMVRKVDVLNKDMLTLRADQTSVEDRLDELESKPTQ